MTSCPCSRPADVLPDLSGPVEADLEIMRRRSGRWVLAAAFLLGSSLVAIFIWRTLVGSETASWSSRHAKVSDHRRPKPAEQDDVLKIETRSGAEVTLRDHKVERIVRKDAQGLAPLERVFTPEGEVEIRRVFNSKGDIISEEAYRNGVKVPVPSKTR